MVRNGEISCNKPFLHFSQCFPQLYLSLVLQNVALCGNGLKLIARKNKTLCNSDFIVGQNCNFRSFKSPCLNFTNLHEKSGSFSQFKYIYLSMIKKQVLTPCTNLLILHPRSYTESSSQIGHLNDRSKN